MKWFLCWLIPAVVGLIVLWDYPTSRGMDVLYVLWVCFVAAVVKAEWLSDKLWKLQREIAELRRGEGQ